MGSLCHAFITTVVYSLFGLWLLDYWRTWPQHCFNVWTSEFLDLNGSDPSRNSTVWCQVLGLLTISSATLPAPQMCFHQASCNKWHGVNYGNRFIPEDWMRPEGALLTYLMARFSFEILGTLINCHGGWKKSGEIVFASNRNRVLAAVRLSHQCECIEIPSTFSWPFSSRHPYNFFQNVRRSARRVALWDLKGPEAKRRTSIQCMLGLLGMSFLLCFGSECTWNEVMCASV